MNYFEIADRLDECVDAFVAKGTSIRRPGGCHECATLPKDGSPPDVLKVKDITSPVGVVSHTGWGYGVVAVELLQFLGDDAAQNLKLGRLVDPTGEIIEEYRTFVGVERVVLRGDQTSLHRICKSCGALAYTYLPRASPYVTAPQVASCRSIYAIEFMQLMVNETIRDRIGKRWSDLITFYEVPVLATPRDGLPVDFGLWPNEEQLIDYKPNLPKWVKR